MSKVTLKIVSSRAQDLYFQDYAPRDSFFDVNDFKFHFATIYSAMFDAVFQQYRKEAKREDGFSNVEITASWLVREELPVQQDSDGSFYIQPSSNIYGFGYDEFSYALDSLKATGDCKHPTQCKTQKISRQEAAYLDISPKTSLCYYWLSAENKISLVNHIGKGIVTYIPSVVGANDSCVLSENIVADVIKATLDIMFKSKNGNVVDEVNDGNKNAILQNQTNPQLNKAQQQS